MIAAMRWAWYVGALSEAATMDLEEAVADLDEKDRIRRTKDPRLAEALENERISRFRLKLGELFKVRGRIRVSLELPETPSRG